MKRFAAVTWFLKNLGLDDAVVGDLIEQHQAGRSRGWLWRQVLTATLHVAKAHAVLTVGAVVLGWTAVWVFFRFVGSPLTRFDQYLLENGLIDRYSAAWWLRSVLMWIVVGFPFVGSGWMVAKVAARNALFPVLTFALSVSATILVALVLDTGQADPAPLRMWLTPVPLFLIGGPATAIVVGGVVGARH